MDANLTVVHVHQMGIAFGCQCVSCAAFVCVMNESATFVVSCFCDAQKIKLIAFLWR